MNYQRLLCRIVFVNLILCFHPLCAMADKSFAGGYGGGELTYGYTHAKFGANAYKAMSLGMGGYLGYGWLKDIAYYGIEGGFGYDAFSKKKGGTHLKQPWQGSFSLRLGRILRSYFLPFLRLGVSHDAWVLRPVCQQTDHFTSMMALLGVGVDVFVADRLSIRSEFNYALSMGLQGSKPQSSKKPIKAGLAMGLSYHF